MKRQEIIDVLSIIEKAHFQEAALQIDKDGFPSNRRSYSYNVLDPDTDKVYPPPYLIELAYQNATGNSLPSDFFAGIKKESGHFDQLQQCGYLIESKLDSKRIDEAMSKLLNRAKLFAELKEDPEAVYKNTQRDHELIKEAIMDESDRWNPKSHFQPVVLLRYMLLQNIQEGVSLDSQLIDGIKNEILSKDISERYDLPEGYRELVSTYTDKDYFKSWKNPFSIVFPFFYSKRFKQFTRDQLNAIVNYLRDRLDLKDVTSKIHGFEGSQNFGADHVWLAIYPKHALSVQDAYQLAISIDKSGFTASLYKGHKVEDESFIAKSAHFMSIEECCEIMKGFYDEWKSLNDRLKAIKSEDRRYWLYAPGANAFKWDEFRNEGIMGLGWTELGDLNHYGSKKEIVQRLQELENTDGSKRNDATANYDFYKTIEIGDVIIAKRGRQEYLGYGIVESEYFYDDDREDFKSCRKVNWRTNGIWPVEQGQIVTKTLTDITKYPDYVQRLKALLGIDVDESNAFNVWVEKSITKNRIDREEGPLKLGSALWSPTKDKRGADIYSEMRLVKPGDVVLHLTDNKGIQGVSLVEKEHDVKQVEEKTTWDGDAYVVQLKEYIELPQYFDRELFLNNKNRPALTQIISDHKVFYNKELNLNQGAYLTESPPELTRILCQSYYDSFQKHLPHLVNYHKGSTDKFKPMAKPTNTIFFGPPGTGKTYTLKTEYFPKYTTKREAVTKEQNFEQVVSNLSWFEAIALAILENKSPMSVPELKANQWIKAKSKYSEAKNIGAILWAQLQAHTIEECEHVKAKRRVSPLIFNKREDKSWEISKEDFEELNPDFTDILEQLEAFQANDHFEIKRYDFVTFHQSYAYEDFIEGIKPVMESEVDGELRYEIKDGLFKTLCKRAKNDPDNRYAIFIDEINRGNVSSIFGELITLIEPDKRLGMDHAMTITLPYSRDAFGVPSNVDIYGTMNTADRSVEALDTALRRRFAFKEMLPKPDLLEKEINGFALKELLSCINERIEALIDRDHTIGHSYLINVNNMDDLKLAFKDKIIPLLQEYFYGDYGKIGLVLGSGFVKMQPQDNEVFADFDYEGSEGLAQNKFELITIDEEFDLQYALETLLNKPR